MPTLKEDALTIINQAIEAVLPEKAVKKQLQAVDLSGAITLVAIGKAAWRMAKAAVDELGDQIKQGIVITKYDHAMGPISPLEIYEAGHPLPDESGIAATQQALKMAESLTDQDLVLFLVSGGGSALFEAPVAGVTLADLTHVNELLLKSGADIVEMNTIRKHLSTVKGGQFARRVAPTKVFSLVLSDVLGDRLDSIASGPAYPDSTSSAEALAIVKKYQLDLPVKLLEALKNETSLTVDNVETFIIGSVNVVCQAAKKAAQSLGYTPLILTTTLNCEAREAGRFLASIGKDEIHHNQPLPKPCAIILGGETVVAVKGDGLGGRNQELALAAAIEIAGLENLVIGSAGTDGTDGPTNAAGGVVDGGTAARMAEKNVDADQSLDNNDAYHALSASGDLLKTGPTGTNVNDITLLLAR